jgi:hypothetical protein
MKRRDFILGAGGPAILALAAEVSRKPGDQIHETA